MAADGINSLDRLGEGLGSSKALEEHRGQRRSRASWGAQLLGASKGVFITTSAFTRDAKEAAIKARGTIELVDGAHSRR